VAGEKEKATKKSMGIEKDKIKAALS